MTKNSKKSKYKQDEIARDKRLKLMAFHFYCFTINNIVNYSIRSNYAQDSTYVINYKSYSISDRR